MVCLILLAIQLVRVSFLQNTKDQKPSLAETLISDEKDVICEGTVYKIENKSQSTAIYLKDAVVSCTDQKSKNQIIKEKKIQEQKILESRLKPKGQLSINNE